MAAKKKSTKKKDQKKPEANTRVEPFSQELRVLLKPEEVADRADRSAQLDADVETKEEQRKADQKMAKSIIEGMKAERRRLQGEVRTRATYHEVPCERRYLYSEGRVAEFRLDTGDEIATRPMTDHEKQQCLPFEPRAPGDGADLEDEFGGASAP